MHNAVLVIFSLWQISCLAEHNKLTIQSCNICNSLLSFGKIRIYKRKKKKAKSQLCCGIWLIRLSKKSIPFYYLARIVILLPLNHVKAPKSNYISQWKLLQNRKRWYFYTFWPKKAPTSVGAKLCIYAQLLQ